MEEGRKNLRRLCQGRRRDNDSEFGAAIDTKSTQNVKRTGKWREGIAVTAYATNTRNGITHGLSPCSA